MAEGNMVKFASALAKHNKKFFPKCFQVSLEAARSFQPDIILASVIELTQARAIGGVMNIPVIPSLLTCTVPSGQESSMLGEPHWLPSWCHFAVWRLFMFLWLA